MTVLSPGNPPSFDQEQTGAGLPLTVTNIRMEFPDLTVIFRFISASSSYVGASTTSIGWNKPLTGPHSDWPASFTARTRNLQNYKIFENEEVKNLIFLYWINEKSCAGLKNLQKPHANVFTGFYLTKDFSITGQNLIPVSIKYASDCLNCNKKTYNQAAVAITVLKTIRSCANTLFQTLTVKIMNAFNNSKLLRHKKQFLKNIAVNCLCLH